MVYPCSPLFIYLNECGKCRPNLYKNKNNNPSCSDGMRAEQHSHDITDTVVANHNHPFNFQWTKSRFIYS